MCFRGNVLRYHGARALPRSLVLLLRVRVTNSVLLSRVLRSVFKVPWDTAVARPLGYGYG